MERRSTQYYYTRVKELKSYRIAIVMLPELFPSFYSYFDLVF